MSHLLVNVSGQIQGVCQINIPCLVIGTREYIGNMAKLKFENTERSKKLNAFNHRFEYKIISP